MNIWKIDPPGDCEWGDITEPYPRTLALSLGLVGQSVAATWQPPHVRVLRKVGGTKRKHADFPWISSSALLCRPNAISAIGDLLQAHGELLPIISEHGLVAFNCTVAIAALDIEASEIERFPSSGRIMVIDRHVFDPVRLGNPVIFRPAELDRVRPLYVGDEFRKRVLDAGLTGLAFRRIWSTDPNAEIPPAFPGW